MGRSRLRAGDRAAVEKVLEGEGGGMVEECWLTPASTAPPGGERARI